MRQNQEQLAKERIAARLASRKQGTGPQGVPDPDNPNDVIGWQDVIIKEVEMKHEEERELLLQVFRKSWSPALCPMFM